MVSDLPHSPHLISPANRLVSCPDGALSGFQLVLHDGKTFSSINGSAVPPPHPAPRLLFRQYGGADFEAVVLLLLGSYRDRHKRIHQMSLSRRNPTYTAPFSGLSFSHLREHCGSPVPGSNLHVGKVPSVPSSLRRMKLGPCPSSAQRRFAGQWGLFLVHQQMVLILRSFRIPKGSHTAGKLTLLGFQKIRGMYLLGNTKAISFRCS